MKIAVVGDHDMILGFLLAGVKLTRSAGNAKETIEALEYFLGLQNVGIIILQASMASLVRTYLTGKIHKKNVYPVILEIEGISGPDKPYNVSKEFVPGSGTDSAIRRSGHV